MGQYRVDADTLTEVAFRLSDAVASGPEGRLVDAGSCGSRAVAVALADDGARFEVEWRSGADAVVDLAVGAVRAADAYRETEARVASGAERVAEPGQ